MPPSDISDSETASAAVPRPLSSRRPRRRRARAPRRRRTSTRLRVAHRRQQYAAGIDARAVGSARDARSRSGRAGPSIPALIAVLLAAAWLYSRGYRARKPARGRSRARDLALAALRARPARARPGADVAAGRDRRRLPALGAHGPAPAALRRRAGAARARPARADPAARAAARRPAPGRSGRARRARDRPAHEPVGGAAAVGGRDLGLGDSGGLRLLGRAPARARARARDALLHRASRCGG